MKIVQKYGGSSLADEECLRRVAARIQRDAQDGNVLVVVSAQGKTTDALTEKYRQVSSEFPSRESDALLVCGELASSALLAATLRSIGVDAVSLHGGQVPILADGPFGNAVIQRINTKKIRKAWRRGQVVVVPGFQGVDRDGNFMTLGRGGSDTSAVALAAALRADRCMIFTDVDGVYSVDPRRFPEAVRFPSVNTATMVSLAEKGAKVLHPKAAMLALEHDVPLEILTSFADREGTMVSLRSPERIGITVKPVSEEISAVTVIFDLPPNGKTLFLLTEAMSHFDGIPYYTGSALQVTLPTQHADDLIRAFHGILYPVE